MDERVWIRERLVGELTVRGDYDATVCGDSRAARVVCCGCLVCAFGWRWVVGSFA